MTCWPPRVSINLSRQLFIECSIVLKVLHDIKATPISGEAHGSSNTSIRAEPNDDEESEAAASTHVELDNEGESEVASLQQDGDIESEAADIGQADTPHASQTQHIRSAVPFSHVASNVVTPMNEQALLTVQVREEEAKYQETDGSSDMQVSTPCLDNFVASRDKSNKSKLARLKKKKKESATRLSKARDEYKKFRSARGKPEDSFSGKLDKALKKVGAK